MFKTRLYKCDARLRKKEIEYSKVIIRKKTNLIVLKMIHYYVNITLNSYLI